MAVHDPPMPDAIQNYQDEKKWGDHHWKWHLERWWFRLNAAQRAYYESQGFSAATRQEGDPGNGLDFLAMHRVMMEILLAEFPSQADLFKGWTTPPTDPYDPDDEVPSLPDGSKPVFPSTYRTAVDRIENQPDTFVDDDAFGLYIQTSRNQGGAVGAGIHNWLHGRWQNITAELNLGDPNVNMKNARFWRLHGWIDAQWSAFRNAKGLPDDQEEYVQALEHARHMMGSHDHHLHDAALTSAPDLRVRSAFSIAPSLSRALFEGEEEARGRSSMSLIDFDFAEVVTEPISKTKFLVVTGHKPYANMDVSLQPRIYVRKPEYWAIEVVGELDQIGLPQVAPFVEALPLEGVEGTLGVEVVGSHRSEKIDIPS